MNALAVLTPAPEVARSKSARTRRTLPALLLLLIGVALIVVPIATGMFSKVASGQQVLDRFQPHLESTALDQVHHDLTVLEAGRTAAAATLAESHVSPGRFPGLDPWTTASGRHINARATGLLSSVQGAVGDYRAVRSIGGFDRIPFLVVAVGLALAYAASVLLSAKRTRYGAVTALALGAAAVLVAYPFLSGLASKADSAQSLLGRLKPIVTDTEVVQLQRDFVVIVTAEGEVDTTFRTVPTSHAHALAALREEWPQISADLADLMGALNDSIPDVRALDSLNNLPVRGHGFTLLPWALAATGFAAGVLALTAQPRTARTRKEQR